MGYVAAVHRLTDPSGFVTCRSLNACRRLPRTSLIGGKETLAGAISELKPNYPPPHSITSSALANNVGGISTPSALAVFRLMIVLNFVACSIGISAGFAPL